MTNIPEETRFQTAFEDGVHYAAQTLMDALHDAGATADEWNDDSTVRATVVSWLQDHDIDVMGDS